jgi:hypothetical protein
VIRVVEEHGILLEMSHQSVKHHRTETKCLAKVVLTPNFECGEDMVKI